METENPNGRRFEKLRHPAFAQPNDVELKVWRFMDLDKFIDILSKRRLFLCRVNLLGDSHEGSIPKVNHAARQDFYEKRKVPDIIPKVVEIEKKMMNSMFVNCWYYDKFESVAMWKIYCPNSFGVAIQTSYIKLVRSTDVDDDLYIGQVNYIDYEIEGFQVEQVFNRVMHKRKAFQYEKEIRLVKRDAEYLETKRDFPPGIYIDWNVSILENIYVNPYAAEWYYDVVRDLMQKYGFDIPLNWSSLKMAPFFR